MKLDYLRSDIVSSKIKPTAPYITMKFFIIFDLL